MLSSRNFITQALLLNWLGKCGIVLENAKQDDIPLDPVEHRRRLDLQ